MRDVRSRLGDPDREVFAQTLGVSARALATYERGDNEPGPSVLKAYRDKHGIDLNWLLSEQGDMFADPSKAPAQAFDDWTMRRVAAIVTTVYSERRLSISPENVAVEGALLYNELIGRVSDLSDRDEIEAALPQLRHLLKKRLDQADAEPGTGKASA